MNKLYNEHIKKEFLKLYEETSQHAIERVFNKSYSAEKLLRKDLYDFNENEIGIVLSELEPHSVDVAKSLGFYIKSYISWAMPYRKSNLNPLDVATDSYFERFVDKSKKIHWAEDELIEQLERLPNGQDKALVMLIFNGILGEEAIELIDLNYFDIDWNSNEIYIASRKEKLKVSDACIKYLKEAHRQQNYYSLSDDNKEFPLVETDYIFKNIYGKKSQDSKQVTSTVIYGRLSRIKDYLSLDYLTTNSIKQSGMIKYAVDLWSNRGKLGKEEFNLIGDRFNLNKIHANGYEYHNKSLMKKYINEENIKKLYGIDVQIS